MPYIIDGNNLIGCSPDIKTEDSDGREKVIHILKKYQASRNNNVILIFDGEPANDGGFENQVENKFKILYPRMGDSADDLIKKILGDYTNYKDVVLVSSDRELKNFAKKKGAKIVNSIEFYYELKRSYKIADKSEKNQKRINVQLSNHEVDHWMKVFTDT